MAATCVITHPQAGVYVATWASLLDGETGNRADIRADCVNRSIQVSGTPTLTTLAFSIEGSNDGLSWGILNDAEGAPLTFDAAAVTANTVKSILENTLYVRPGLIAGDEVTDLKIVLVAS